jgi:macrocin-O-methyltransferase TylF-like protien
MREILYRARDPQFLADSVLRAVTKAWDLVSPSEFAALYRHVRPYTMCSSARLRGLHKAVQYVARNEIRGDMVECGCAKGGFERLHVSEDVQFVKGMFQDSLAATPIQAISLPHVDGDWNESVKTCLENLYEKVTPGGVIQLDDYGYWKGARRAVDEFLQGRGIRAPLQRLDYSGRSLLKPG